MQRKVRRIGLTVLACMLVPLAMTLTGQQPQQRRATRIHTNNLYIVQMGQPPVVVYGGGIDNLRATRPTRGQKINSNSAEVVTTWHT